MQRLGTARPAMAACLGRGPCESAVSVCGRRVRWGLLRIVHIGALKTLQPREHQFLRNRVGKLYKGPVVNIFQSGGTWSLF